MQEYKIHNADLMFKEDSTVDDLIDMIEGNRRYVKCVYVYNKIDVCSMEEVEEIAGRPFSIPISCYHKLNLEGLLEMIWDMMVRSSTGCGWMWVGMCEWWWWWWWWWRRWRRWRRGTQHKPCTLLCCCIHRCHAPARRSMCACCRMSLAATS